MTKMKYMHPATAMTHEVLSSPLRWMIGFGSIISVMHGFFENIDDMNDDTMCI